MDRSARDGKINAAIILCSRMGLVREVIKNKTNESLMDLPLNGPVDQCCQQGLGHQSCVVHDSTNVNIGGCNLSLSSMTINSIFHTRQFLSSYFHDEAWKPCQVVAKLYSPGNEQVGTGNGHSHQLYTQS